MIKPHKHHEDTVTALVAAKIVELRPEWDVRVQEYFSATSKRPDLIITLPGNAPVLFEAKWDNPVSNDVEIQAGRHVGLEYTVHMDDGTEFNSTVDASLAVRYPNEWKKQSLQELMENIAAEEFRVTCIKQINGTVTYLSGESPMPSTLMNLMGWLELISNLVFTPNHTNDNIEEVMVDPDDIMSTEWFKEQLADRGLKYDDVANYLNIKMGSVSHWLNRGGIPRGRYAQLREFLDQHPVQNEQVHIPSA